MAKEYQGLCYKKTRWKVYLSNLDNHVYKLCILCYWNKYLIESTKVEFPFSLMNYSASFAMQTRKQEEFPFKIMLIY